MPIRYINIELDSSDFDKEIQRLRSVMTREQFERAMYRVFTRVPGHVRKVLRQELPKKYFVRAGAISSATGAGSMISGGTFGPGCIIPIRDHRGSIGGRYHATGGAHGWAAVRRRKRYKVKADIVKAGKSILPEEMKSYGGFPPFRNYNAPKLNGVTFTRVSKKRKPIMKVSGIAIPQMPTNRSEPEVQKDIRDYMQKRMEHEFMRLIASGH